MKFLDEMRERMAGQSLKRRVSFSADGFDIAAHRQPSASVSWTDVREIFGFKRDLFSVDEICLGFSINESGDYFWVGEEDDGFDEIRREVERRFRLDADWVGKIMKPAFVENRTILWQRT
jgi:hypothetical protein